MLVAVVIFACAAAYGTVRTGLQKHWKGMTLIICSPAP